MMRPSCLHSTSVLVGLLLFLQALPAAQSEDPKPGVPQVWDGGKWNEYNEEPDEPLPHPPKSDSWRSDDATILVSISSFRDFRCPKTLLNLFTKAKNPNRVRVGVVQQNDKGDPDCLNQYCVMMKELKGITPSVTATDKVEDILANCPYVDNVRMMRVMSTEAKGPTYGRYLGGKLLGDEEFCMQTDAHMDFLFEWDALLLRMWGLTRNEYAVLTTYVPRLEELGINANERWEIPHICRTFFTPGDRMVRNEQAKAAIWLTRPKLTSTWAAGFAFNKCHADYRASYDPHLPSLFDGEEFSKYARLWTRGYDTYTPHRSIVYHDYNHGPETSKAGAWTRKQEEVSRSADRLKTLLGAPDATVHRNSSEAHAMLGKWDLGSRRTLSQLIDFTGVDTTKYEITKSSCGKLSWVPFVEKDDKDGGLDDDSNPMVTAYEVYAARQGKDEEEEAVGRGLLQAPETAEPGGDPAVRTDALYRAALSLSLSCIALCMLVAWWSSQRNKRKSQTLID